MPPETMPFSRPISRPLSITARPSMKAFAAAALLLAAVPLGAQVRFEVRGESGVAGEPILAGLNQVVKPTLYIANPAGGGAPTIQGFQMALSHDPTFLEFQSVTWRGTPLETLRTNNGPYFYNARQVTTGGVTGITLGVLFEDQAPTFVLGVGDHKVAILSYRAARATPEGTPTRLDFATELGTPPVDNRYDDRGTMGTGLPAVKAGAAVSIGAELAYTVAFREPRLSVEPGTEFTVPVLIQNSPRAVHGFSFGVKHDNARLELVDVTLSESLKTILGGPADARFLSIQKSPVGGPGFTVAMVLSPTDRTKLLDPARSPHHVIDALYRSRATTGPSNLVINGDMGQPRVEVILDLFGVAQRPQPPATNPPPTTFIVEVGSTTNEPRFIRGDVDQNGRISITDAIGIISHLFDDPSEIPAAFSNTITNCLIAFNVDGNLDPTGTEIEDRIDITDPVFILTYLFLRGPPPPAPFDGGRTCAAFTGKASARMNCTQFNCR